MDNNKGKMDYIFDREMKGTATHAVFVLVDILTNSIKSGIICSANYFGGVVKSMPKIPLNFDPYDDSIYENEYFENRLMKMRRVDGLGVDARRGRKLNKRNKNDSYRREN